MEYAIQSVNLVKIFRTPTLSWPFRLRESVALDRVCLAVPPGEIIGLVGRNGEGKTTFLKILAGLIEPTSGDVRIFGGDVFNTQSIRQKIGLITSDERSFYWRLSGWENLMFFARLYGLLDRTFHRQLEALIEYFELPSLIHQPFFEYSTGNKQKLSIVRALMTNPQLLLMDEPTRSLDPHTSLNLCKKILHWVGSDSGKTVLIATHNLSEIETLSDKIVILYNHAIQEFDTLDNLKRKYSLKKKIRLTVQGNHLSDRGVWLSLGVAINELQADRFIELEFEKDRLNEIMRLLLANQYEINDFQVVNPGLREIVQTL